MRIECLSLSGFRNLEDIILRPVDGANVIWGDNAQGKTNLLEALWLFTGEKSFRGGKEKDFIAFGKETARLSLDFISQGREQSAEISLSAQQKQISLNGIRAERQRELTGVFRAVVFSPDHLELVKGEPGKRRKMLDSSLCQAYPKYAKVLESYEKILKQRARLLKDAPEHPQLLDMLEVWDDSLIEYGGYISWMRARYLSRLAGYAADNYAGIAGGKERFAASYLSSCGELPEEYSREAFTQLMQKAVGQSRGKDIALGMTHVGPHRDDLEIQVNDQPARAFASQGQQRSCVLALKLAECRILEEGGGEPPVVLLDDVMSELDEGRRRYLLNHLEGRQIFITCCEGELFRSLVGGKTFYIREGSLREE